MTLREYAVESLVYRTAGLIDAMLAGHDPNDMQAVLAAVEEFAVEASIAKVAGSETLSYVLDENIQVHGGNGFVNDYPAERHYRDARVNRIFEGTNEINRLIITGWLLKRAMTGQLPLMPAIKKLMDEVLSGPGSSNGHEGLLANEAGLVANAKKIALFTAGAASQKYMQGLVDQQEIMGALADIIIETFMAESCLLRAQKLAKHQGESASALAIAMAQVYLDRAMGRIEENARRVIAAVAEGDMLRTQMAILRRLLKREPFNTIGLQQKIADRILEQEKYVTA
jgi:butyryl-CoA dehydrogenase